MEPWTHDNMYQNKFKIGSVQDRPRHVLAPARYELQAAGKSTPTKSANTLVHLPFSFCPTFLEIAGIVFETAECPKGMCDTLFRVVSSSFPSTTFGLDWCHKFFADPRLPNVIATGTTVASSTNF